jgi:hypothetical protein
MRDKIKKIIKEEVGVPEGIVETAELIYNQVIDKLNSLSTTDENNDKFMFYLKGDYKISDYKFKKIELTLEIVRTDEVSEGKILGMSFMFASKLDNKNVILHHIPTKNKIELSITMAIPEDGDLNDVIKEFESENTLIISSLTHELMHSYEKFKRPTYGVTSRSDYDAYTNLRFGIEPIDDLLHNLYFIHSIENVVRPSEVAADLKSGNIKKSEFLEFLKSNRVYQMLKKINGFTYERFKNELLNYDDIIRERLTDSGIDNIPENNEELVEMVLRLLRVTLVNGKESSLKRDLTTDFFEEITGFSGKKEQVFDNYIKKIQKYDNNDSFFKNEEKMFKFISYNLIKKIHKLYSILEKNKKTNESIINWDLYHKVKKTPIVIENESHFDDDNEGRKVKLIQKYLDNVVTPSNDLICDAKVFRFSNSGDYNVRIWVNQNKNTHRDEFNDLVDSTWEYIFNMFEIPVSVQKINSEC